MESIEKIDILEIQITQTILFIRIFTSLFLDTKKAQMPFNHFLVRFQK